MYRLLRLVFISPRSVARGKRRPPVEQQMDANPTSADSTRYPLRLRFVLVNDRVPRTDANCALCCAKIERGYVREPHTRLVYCDAQCFAGHGKIAVTALVNRARRVS
jgi:hypothetical protein